MMSSLMAFSLTGLEQWTTWILLGLLAIWGKSSSL
jgi:presenilin 1